MSNSNVNEVNRSFSGLDVAVRTGSRRKKALSNRVEISVDDSRTSATLRLTLRQARVLQKILNTELGK
jgi:hypothetical protein